MNTLFTIGHSDHLAGQFISLLCSHGVKAVVDVRSHPNSQRFPQFNGGALEIGLKRSGLHYVFLGRELGARREEPECYVDGRADYILIAKTSAFCEGIKRVQYGLEKMPIALLCAEYDPITCHRMILVCRHLRALCPEIKHILRDGSIELNQEAERRLVRQIGGCGDSNITASIIETAYDIQGQNIAFSDERVDVDISSPQKELHFSR